MKDLASVHSESSGRQARIHYRSLGNLAAALLVLTGLCAVLAGCKHAALDPQPDADIAPQHLFMFSALRAPASATGVTALRIDLGRRLYYDAHLSENDSVSCNSCHQLNHYGIDPGKAVSYGHSHHPGTRNSPTVYNAGLEFAQFWDGRAPTLAAQATGPMMNPVEMGMSGPGAVLAYIRSQPDYVRQLHVAYPDSKDPVTLDNVTDAIATFEAGLLTPARWDRYLQGDASALTNAEKQGLRVFLRTGCAACHAGAGMGGNSYEQLGAARNWPDQTDLGRGGVTHRAADRMYFKVPMLRNVEKTGPYFHNGRVQSLDEAVHLMAEYEAGQKLDEADVHSIVLFLHALTGEIPRQYIQPPPATTTRAAVARASRRAAAQQAHAAAAVFTKEGQ